MATYKVYLLSGREVASKFAMEMRDREDIDSVEYGLTTRVRFARLIPECFQDFSYKTYACICEIFAPIDSSQTPIYEIFDYRHLVEDSNFSQISLFAMS